MALPAIFDPLVNASMSQKITLGLVGLAVIVGGGYFLLLSPLQARVAAQDGQNRSVQAELVQTRAAIADLARFRRETSAIERQLEATREKLPAEREISTLYRTLSESAFQSGLEVGTFQPKEPRVHDYYTEIPIAMAVEGGYHQLGKFFERVAAIPRIVTVSDLKVAGLGKGRSSLHADVTVSTYVYRPIGAHPVSKGKEKK